MGYRLSILVFVLAALLVGAIFLPAWYFGSRIAVEARFEAKVRWDRAEASSAYEWQPGFPQLHKKEGH